MINQREKLGNSNFFNHSSFDFIKVVLREKIILDSPLTLEDKEKKGTKQRWTFLHGHLYPYDDFQFAVGSSEFKVGSQLMLTKNIDESVWLIESEGLNNHINLRSSKC